MVPGIRSQCGHMRRAGGIARQKQRLEHGASNNIPAHFGVGGYKRQKEQGCLLVSKCL